MKYLQEGIGWCHSVHIISDRTEFLRSSKLEKNLNFVPNFGTKLVYNYTYLIAHARSCMYAACMYMRCIASFELFFRHKIYSISLKNLYSGKFGTVWYHVVPRPYIVSFLAHKMVIAREKSKQQIDDRCKRACRQHTYKIFLRSNRCD